MDKKFLKILTISAIITALEGSGTEVSADFCESLGTDVKGCQGDRTCKVAKDKGGIKKCFTKCSLYTKQAKQDKAKDKKSTKDLCTEYNDACVEGKWLGMFKCRNKELQPSEDKDE